MDEDFEEPKESDRLIMSPPFTDSVPPEVFEMEAILARRQSGSLGSVPPKTDQPQLYLSNIEEQPERDGAESRHSIPKNTLGLTLTVPEAQLQQPELSDMTSTLLFIDEDNNKQAAGAKDDGSSVDQLRKPGKVPSLRIVAPPTMSPDVPTSPALTSPIWVPVTKH